VSNPPPTPGTRTITAFLDGEDSPDISNPIHSTAVAREYGFPAPLVGGVTVYGWCVPAILQSLGERWLDEGWVDVRFRRPVFPGDVMTATVADGALAMANGGGERCLVGAVGLGRAPWAGELSACASRAAVPALSELPELTLETHRWGPAAHGAALLRGRSGGLCGWAAT
jgi:MaoC like domain